MFFPSRITRPQNLDIDLSFDFRVILLLLLTSYCLQNEYKRGISGWNFNLEDMKAQASLVNIHLEYLSMII